MRRGWLDWWFVRFWVAVLIISVIAHFIPIGK